MKLYCVVAVAFLVVALCSQAESQNANGPDECCFSYFTRAIPPRAIKEYKLTSSSCPKKGVIFTTLKNKKLCVNPEDKQAQEIMDRVDDLFGTLPTTSSR